MREPPLWIEAVADALGIRREVLSSELVVVADRLQGRQALIVLDNFKHVLAAANGLEDSLPPARC